MDSDQNKLVCREKKFVIIRHNNINAMFGVVNRITTLRC